MATIKHIFKGESLSMLFAFPAEYDMARIQSHGIWIGGTELTGVIIGQGIELKLTSLQTDLMSGNQRVSLWLDDVILGVRKPYVGDIAVGNTNALSDNESTSEVYDVIVNVDISETAIEAGDLMFNYVKGDPLTYDDLTPEQIAELQRPATDAIASIQEVELAVETAEVLRQQAEINRQSDTATAISNAENATEDANDAAILANEKAGLANDAAILANEKAGLAETATTQANEARDGANSAANAATNLVNSYATDLAAKELKANKQNSLTPDGTGTKFPTVDAVNEEIANLAGELSLDIYNLTEKNPLDAGKYYNHYSAKEAVPVLYRKKGLQITYVNAENERFLILITSASTASGDVIISLDGSLFNIPVSAGDSTSVIAGKIRATVFAGWTVFGGSAVVIFSKNTIGINPIPIFNGETTGVKASISILNVGKNEKWITEQFIGSDINDWMKSESWKSDVYVNTPSINIFDKSKCSFGYLNGAGEIAVNFGMFVTDFMPVVNGDVIYTNFSNSNPTWGAAIYNSNKAFIAKITNPNGFFNISVSNAKFIRIVYYGLSFVDNDYRYFTTKNQQIPKDKYSAFEPAKTLNPENKSPIISAIFDEQYRNLLDDSNRYLSGGTINPTTGEPAPGTGVGHTMFIEINPLKLYLTNAVLYNWGAIYDANKTYLSSITAGIEQSTETNYFKFKNTNAKYVRLTFSGSIPISNAYLIEYIQPLPTGSVPIEMLFRLKENIIQQLRKDLKISPIDGMIWNALGDSITAAPGKVSYHKLISLTDNVLVRNYGYSGSRIAREPSNPSSLDIEMSTRYATMNDNADIITVMGGINDMNNALPLGTISDTTNVTFYGAMDVLLRGLHIKYQGKKLGFITPLNYGNTAHLPYFEAIYKMCEKYSFPILNLYSEGLINTQINEIKNNFISDGLHPDDSGHVVMSRKIREFLYRL